MTIKFKKLSDKAVQPVRSTTSGAGYNLSAAGITTEVNERGQLVLVYHTNVAIEMPEGYEAVLRPSNTINTKTLRMLDAPSVLTGNMDDEIVARFITTTDVVPAVYKEGDIIAQLVINKIEDVEFVEFIDTTEQSAAADNQGPSEEKDESTNPETVDQVSGGEENIPEEAQ